MRGHQQSNTRKLNRHWQSGGGGLRVVSFYMNGHYPYSASQPTSNDIYINNPTQANPENITIDRQNRSTPELIQFISDGRQNRMYTQWGSLATAMGEGLNGAQPAARSTYYGHDEEWNFMNLFNNRDKYKLINLFVGGFYKQTGQDGLIRAYFNDEYTRARFYGPIYLPTTISSYTTSSRILLAEFDKLAAFYDKVHIWMPYPRMDAPVLSPSSNFQTGAMYNPDGSTTQVSLQQFPFTIALQAGFSSYWYDDSMLQHPVNIHLHLPTTFDLSNVSVSPTYVREYKKQYTNQSGVDIWTWGCSPMAGNTYTRKVFIHGPFSSGSNPSSSSPWYRRTFREYMPIGDIIIHTDIDISKTVEENMRNYAATI